MLHKSLVKRLEKEGFEIIKCEMYGNPNQLYLVKGKSYDASWYNEGVIDVKITNPKDPDDIQTDYFPSFFASTIKEVVKYLNC